MKTQNSVSQKIRMLHNINLKKKKKRGRFKQKCQASEKYVNYQVGPPFAQITASMQRAMEAIGLWLRSGVMEAQVALIAAFKSRALSALVSLSSPS